MSNLLSRSILFCLCFFLGALNAFTQEQNQANMDFRNTIGGSFSLNSAQNNRNLVLVQANLFDNLTRSNSFNFSPYYLRSIKPNLRVGVILNYSISNFESVSPSTVIQVFPILEPENDRINSTNSTNTSIGAWIFARSKIKQFNKFHIFTEPMIGIQNSVNDTEGLTWVLEGTNAELAQQSSRNERITNLLNIRVNLGIGYALSQRWNLISRLGNLSYSAGSITENFESSTGGTGTFSDSSKVDVSEFNLSFRPSSFTVGLEYNF